MIFFLMHFMIYNNTEFFLSVDFLRAFVKENKKLLKKGIEEEKKCLVKTFKIS